MRLLPSLVRRAWGRVAGTGALGTFALAHVVADAADSFAAVSLAGSLFFNVSPNASRNQVLLYLGITMVPFLLLAPLVGPAIDRYRGAYRALASGTYLLRAVAALGLAFTLFELSFYVFALVLLVASKASGVIRQALVPRFVPDVSQLVAVNARLARLASVFGASGAVAAAALIVATSASAVLGVASSLFVVCAAVVWFLPRTVPAAEVETPVVYAELHTPSVVVASTGLMVLRAGVGYFIFVLAFALRRASEPAWVYALVASGYAVGSFSGLLLAPRLRRRANEETLMGAALAATAVMCAIAVLSVGRATLTVLALVLGAAATTGRQAFDSLLQRAAPDALRGQAFARYELRFQLTWVLGAAVATAIRLPVEGAVGVLAALFVPAVVVYVRSAREALRFDPLPDVDLGAPAAGAHLAGALRWHHAGRCRQACIEASAAFDLARAAGGGAAAAEVATMERLRRLAVEDGHEPSPADAEEAIRIARAAVDVIPPVAPTRRSIRPEHGSG